MEYIEGIKKDQEIELLGKLVEMIEYDLRRKYPDLVKQPSKNAKV